MSKTIFMKYLPPVRPKLVPNTKVLAIYWNFSQLIFRTSWSRSWCQKLFLLDTTCSAKLFPKINAQDLLKFGTSDVSNISISILMWQIIFMKYLPPVRPKLVPKLKVFRIYWNLAQLIFRVSRSSFWCQKLFLLNTYYLLGPKWSQIGTK